MVTHDCYSGLPQHWDSVCELDTDDNHVRNATKTMHAYIISCIYYFNVWLFFKRKIMIVHKDKLFELNYRVKL
jgi:hypothetical protein